MGKKAVHFGAGNIGRGFIAERFHLSGYEVVFADVMDSVIKDLQANSSYKVVEVGADGEHTSEITNYRAINSKHQEAEVVKEISSADVVTCAVGPNILKFIAPVIAKAIDARDAGLAPLAVIACENMINATTALHKHIEEHTKNHDKAEYANSAIDRIVPMQDADAGLNVKLESFFEWVVDQTPFKAGPPEIDGVKWVDNLEPYIERKLFTVNTGHAAAAYWGYAKGKKTVYDALSDKFIHEEVRKALQETSRLIVDKHGIKAEEQAAYVEKIITRISNPHLEDIVARVGRAPLRKLGRKERFIGPASQLAERGEKVDALLEAAEMAFRFQNVEGDEESAQLAKILAEQDANTATTTITGLEESHPLFKQVVAIVTKVKGSS
ncbi:MAG: hypothetical protein M1814_004699 [Vezdaea aestivalis]|nr:MAG: hypothetical protein M1814_004699 [Vezdaea aestivalis]